MQFERAGEFIMNKMHDDLPDYFTYHNTGHIQDVYNAAECIGKQENVAGNDMKLLLTAAWYHDAGYLIRTTGHEDESCRIAREALPAYNYTSYEIEQICGMIMATRIPQSPKNHLEQILADADLDYLGREDFLVINNKLFTEFSYLGMISNETDWYRTNIAFLENHHYFTKTSVNLRKAQKDINLAQVKSKIN